MDPINKISNILQKNTRNLANIKSYELIFIALLLLYLLSNVSTPYNYAPHINNIYMYFSLIIIFIILLVNSNPLIALLFAIVAYIFLQRSKKVDHKVMAQSETNRSSKMEQLNTHLNSKSLEEEMVHLIEQRPKNIASIENYNPVVCDTYSASNI
jgi:predicted membrane protein